MGDPSRGRRGRHAHGLALRLQQRPVFLSAGRAACGNGVGTRDGPGERAAVGVRADAPTPERDARRRAGRSVGACRYGLHHRAVAACRDLPSGSRCRPSGGRFRRRRSSGLVGGALRAGYTGGRRRPVFRDRRSDGCRGVPARAGSHGGSHRSGVEDPRDGRLCRRLHGALAGCRRSRHGAFQSPLHGDRVALRRQLCLGSRRRSTDACGRRHVHAGRRVAGPAPVCARSGSQRPGRSRARALRRPACAR